MRLVCILFACFTFYGQKGHSHHDLGYLSIRFVSFLMKLRTFAFLLKGSFPASLWQTPAASITPPALWINYSAKQRALEHQHCDDRGLLVTNRQDVRDTWVTPSTGREELWAYTLCTSETFYLMSSDPG